MSRLAPVITPELLASIRAQPDLPSGAWPYITVTVLCILNRPDEIEKVYLHAIQNGDGSKQGPPTTEQQLSITRRMREALLKAAMIGGMPKTINAMTVLRSVTPDHCIDGPLDVTATSHTGDVRYASVAEIIQRGRAFFNKTYGKVAGRVMGHMEQSGSPDLSQTAQLVYGYVLSNVDILGPAETSFVMIAGLVPMDVNPQLKGHLKGALNGGATVAEVMAVRSVAIAICNAAGMQRLADDAVGGWGWRSDVASL